MSLTRQEQEESTAQIIHVIQNTVNGMDVVYPTLRSPLNITYDSQTLEIVIKPPDQLLSFQSLARQDVLRFLKALYLILQQIR